MLQRFTSSLVQDYGLEEVLDDLSSEICILLDVHGAGVMLEDDNGNLRFTSSSDPVLERLESLQIELDEGPCLLAYHTGEMVQAGDIANDLRFEKFGPAAVNVGMKAVFSFPMKLESTVAGALNFYRRETVPLSPAQEQAAKTLADIATAFLLHAREDDRSRLLTRQLQHALDSRIPIEQAKGFVAARLDVDVDVAFNLLRGYARSHRTSLDSVVAQVVDRTLSIAALSNPSPD